MLVVVLVIVVLFGIEIISLKNMQNDNTGEELQLEESPIQDSGMHKWSE